MSIPDTPQYGTHTCSPLMPMRGGGISCTRQGTLSSAGSGVVGRVFSRGMHEVTAQQGRCRGVQAQHGHPQPGPPALGSSQRGAGGAHLDSADQSFLPANMLEPAPPRAWQCGAGAAHLRPFPGRPR